MPEPKPAQVAVRLEAAGDTHIGGRPHNEDAILLRPDLQLFIVADGAGGQNAGNVASSLAVTTVAHFFEETEQRASALPLHDGLGLFTAARRLSTAVQEANKEILTIAKTSDRHKGMGTTVAAALFDLERHWLHLAYVGDSRCYRLRGGRFELLSFDHSLINDVLELRPNIDDERIHKLPKNVITRALGMSQNLRVSVRTHELDASDRFLLCSDGLSDVVTEDQLREVLGSDAECNTRVETLMKLALEQKADDNVACLIVDCRPMDGDGTAVAKAVAKQAASQPPPAVEPAAAAGPSHDLITEESVPEIMLYDNVPAARESSPLIHVVPAQSTTDDVLDAVKGVVAPLPKPRTPEPPKAPPPPKAKAKAKPALKKPPTPAKPKATPPPLPASTGSDAPERSTPVGLPPAPSPKRMPFETDASSEAENDGPETTRIGVEPEHQIADDLTAVIDEEDDDDEPATLIHRESKPPHDEVEAASLEFRAQMEAKRSSVPKPRPAAGAPAPPAKSSLAAPRRNKPDAATDLGAARTGDTRRPAESQPPPKVAMKRPRRAPLPRTLRGTLPGAAPPPEIVREMEARREQAKRARDARLNAGGDDPPSEAFELKRPPVPPMRPQLDTSEFILEETIPCHACGSVIARTAEICMYCGATTGFVTE